VASPPIAHDDADYCDLPTVPDRRGRPGGERDAQVFETLKAAWAVASDAVRRRFRTGSARDRLQQDKANPLSRSEHD
jgi:hypothetical protein